MRRGLWPYKGAYCCKVGVFIFGPRPCTISYSQRDYLPLAAVPSMLIKSAILSAVLIFQWWPAPTTADAPAESRPLPQIKLLKPLPQIDAKPLEPLQQIIPPLTEAQRYIFEKESGGRLDAVNAGGCIGLGQDCNGWLVTGRNGSPACPDWRTNYYCQLQYWDWYANTVYGGWANAYAFRASHNYW